MTATPRRLHPFADEATTLEWLSEQARRTWGAARLPALAESLALIARAICAVSAAEVPDALEPRFP